MTECKIMLDSRKVRHIGFTTSSAPDFVAALLLFLASEYHFSPWHKCDKILKELFYIYFLHWELEVSASDFDYSRLFGYLYYRLWNIRYYFSPSFTCWECLTLSIAWFATPSQLSKFSAIVTTFMEIVQFKIHRIAPSSSHAKKTPEG